MKTLYFITTILIFLTINSDGQTGTSSKHNQPYPVIRHTVASTLPDTIHVVGYLTDAPARGMCGVYCMGGTIKVKLKTMIPGYKDEFVYLVTACIGDKIPLDGKIDVIASKLKKNETECYYNSIMNPFDSRGLSFYKLSEKETSKIH